MKSFPKPLIALTAVIFLSACDKTPKQAPPPPKSDAVTPARQTSFEDVTRQLDPGGSVYVYMSTDQWLGEASTKLIELGGMLQEMPGMSSEDRRQVEGVFGLLTGLVRGSGVEDLAGVGLSGVQITPELHRTKLILHHKPGHGEGFLWSMMGAKPHELAALNLLNTNTALAAFGDFDVRLMWQVIEKEVASAGIPELSGPLKNWPALFEQQTKLPWDQVLGSFGGEAGIVITMDSGKMIRLPVPGQTLDLPEPALMLVAKVNDDLIFERIKSELAKTSVAQITEKGELKMIVLPMPLPLPIEIRITIASGGGYLFVASSPTLVEDAMAVRAGTQPGLRQVAGCADLLKYLPVEGNQLVYVDRRFSEVIQNVQRQALNSASTDLNQRKFMEKFILSQAPQYGMSVGTHTPTGWQTVTVGNQDASLAVMAAPVAGVTAVGAAMVLPALARAKDKAQSINCMNNMKQILLAFRIWSMDNGDMFPFNVSKEKKGSLEFRELGADGYDANSWHHLQVMAAELGTPKILVCPSDKSKTAASSFDELGAGNVSYQIRTGISTDLANGREVMLFCPIHHHKGMVDGSVQAGKPN